MKKIVIVNGLGFGREVADWISQMPGYNYDFCLKGFLDDRQAAHQMPGLPVIGTPEEYQPHSEDVLVIALSNPEQKEKSASKFRQLGCSFFSVIHPSSVISLDSELGNGCIIAPYNSVSSGVRIGDFVSLYGFCRIGHDARIGSYCHIASHCSLGGNCHIPEGTFLNEFTHIPKQTL